MKPYYDKWGIQVFESDCLKVMRDIPDESVSAVITDPPSGIGFMNREWDKDRGGRDRWVEWLTERMTEAHRVLKPGGHALVWALPRTSHWTALALENAGFEIRDCIAHLFGTGFPKSLSVGQAIDKASGARCEVIGTKVGMPGYSLAPSNGDHRTYGRGLGNTGDPDRECAITAPVTVEARLWEGWGTALKPATEHWWLCRKPLSSTVAGTVLEHGTGALNIAATRVSQTYPWPAGSSSAQRFHPDSLHDTAAAVLGCDLDLPLHTSVEQLACNNDDTVLDRESEIPHRNYNTDAQELSAALLEPHSDLAANVQRCGSTRPLVQDSPDDYPTSLHSCDERVQSGAGDAQGSSQQPLDAHEYLDPYSTSERNPLVPQSMALTNDTVFSAANTGRWPPNVIFSHSPLLDPDTGEVVGDACADGCVDGCAVRELDRQSAGTRTDKPSASGTVMGSGMWGIGGERNGATYTDSGGASRFFHCFRWADTPFIWAPKAPTRERPKVAGELHSTVKPVSLLRVLARLITPPGGTILDCFAGTGTTGQAARAEGFRCILIDDDPQAAEWIRARLDALPKTETPDVEQVPVEPDLNLFDLLGDVS